ncbi:MAG: DUF366 family protein [Candidatus Heimdallarchaeum aukensis]|uniref:DUF366 family protein n=1 Tax=Candidatus Heimdallarchaeum aukensis TaxID=2876573 RepID=A0A9Y1FKN7_9ARCH|nr:MAG: DUF366 family protein [Candidatus Heimdallarchaeum aukensis]
MSEEKLEDYTIKYLDFNEKICYDGSQIQSLYTYEHYNVPGNSVLIFRGDMKLTPKEMLDLKDILNEFHLAKVLISSDDAIHFIVEEFDVQPPNLEIMYYRLRILTIVVIESLVEKGVNLIQRKGTDIYVNGKKLNVGIATIGGNSGKIHFGINISSDGVPNHVQAIGLKEIGFSEEELLSFAISVAKKYVQEIDKVKHDIVKTRVIK